MDWDYVLTISPEDLTEEEKDDLYNTVTWLNCDEENLNLEKSLALVKVSQEILKYKGEQVEILLHKLDELATQQGEEAVRKVDSDDGRSSKSRKSSSIEIENLEQKYSELKIKYRKQVKTNEKNSAEIARLTKKIASMEQERSRLLSEIQMSQDDSRSDMSESIKEQHKELTRTVHNKNQQISDLLRDIEEIEKDNTALREKMTNVRDELSNATKELTTLSETLKSSELRLKEAAETIDKITIENENLRDEARETLEQKQNFEKEMEEFTAEVNVRVDEWKRILDEKDREIDELKSRKQSSIHSSLSSLPREHSSQTHVSALHKLLAERERQLLDVKVKLQEAVKEMEEATKVIRELTQEKEEKSRKVDDLSELLKEVKKQLKASHERSQDLQDSLAHAEKTIENQDRDVKEILAKLKSDGEHDVADNLEQIQELKGQNRLQEKQIVNLVKASNKLQDLCDRFEKENEYLRDKAGMSGDDVIDAEVATKQKQQRREVALLKRKVEALEETRLQLKMENHSLNKAIHQLTETGKQDVMSELSKYEIVQPSKDVTEDGIFYQNQSKALVEENEALRRGLHEIMDSLNSRKESSLKELKSETFENLLRALDAKHISGWYHPAMRFQAEMHNLEGINAELREQLRLARIEMQSQRSMRDIDLDSISETPDLDTVNNIRNNLKNLMMKLETECENTSELATSMESYKDSFVQIRLQVSLLYEEYMKSKRDFQDELSKYEDKLRDLEESDEIKREKLHLLNQDDDTVKAKSLELVEENVKLKRKCDFLQNQTAKLSDRVSTLQTNLSQAEVACLKKINDLTKKNQTLSIDLEILKTKSDGTIEPELYEKLRKDLEALTIKHREALRNFEQVGRDAEFELKLLVEGNQLLCKEKTELMSKLCEILEKLHRCENSSGEVHENVASLTKKLSEYEVNALGEKQRANHTNNLYELVKEQLQKSEERLAQFENFNKEVLQKNVLMQEQLRDVEKKVGDAVDRGSYKALQNQYNEALQANANLNATLNDLNQQLVTFKSAKKIEIVANKEQELLHLKHLIVDLQAASDEKMQISRLSNDLAHLQAKQDEFEEKIQKLEANLRDSIKEREDVQLQLQNRSAEWSEIEVELRKKLGILRELLANHKLQYLGCVPLCSEEKYVDNIRKAISDKHRAFLQLHSAQVASNDAHTLKEQYENELKNLERVLKLNGGGDFESILVGHQERKLLQFNEVKLKRQLELKEAQIRHVFERVKVQDDQLMKLEEELYALHNNYFDFDLMNSPVTSPPPQVEVPKTPPKDAEQLVKESTPLPEQIKLTRSKDTQTLFEIDTESTGFDKTIGNLRIELLKVSSELEEKNQQIQELKSKITEHEMNISLFRKQLGDKQSQITFYEKHILELQSKVSSVLSSPSDGAGEKGDEILAMKSSLKTFQDTLKQKEDEVLHYQSLLKEDRDKHSLAAALMREELKVLQKCLAEEKQKCADLRGSINETHPSKAALEQYFVQVHALEDELSQLRTMVSSLDSQLRASRQEAVRWRTLANDRLESMHKLGQDLEELHQNEIQVYKNESEKWFEEISILKMAMSKCRGEMWQESDHQKLTKEKDDRIHELAVMLRQARNEAKRTVDRSDNESVTRLTELEVAREQLLKEHDALKKRFDQLLNRERSAREEIRDLKAKLLRKPILSARSDKSERSIKDQLLKKVSALENEIVDLKENLARQVAINETHRVQISQDFDRWNKQKHFQQTVEKLKSKLKAKEQDFEKLQETCVGYRILIERMEREKYGLENKVRSLKSFSGSQLDATELEILRSENSKLILENENLLAKLEMQRQHSGGLGAAMLQEKLEAQERKIAILEVTSKGSMEVRTELERLQNAVSGLQKANLCLEAENLELKLDLERSSKEAPHLREQIQHLENYTEVLKTENRGQGDEVSTNPRAESKKISELERTIFVLKRVVEKLQAENKRLSSSGGKRPCMIRSASAEKLQRDHQRLKLQYDECLQKVSKLEQELSLVTSPGSVEYSLRRQQNKPVCGGGGDSTAVLSDELRDVKEQLEQKSHLLNKVKVLLHRAAVREKALLQEIADLKGQRQEHEEKSDENSA